jgi:hypothetical protein
MREGDGVPYFGILEILGDTGILLRTIDRIEL